MKDALKSWLELDPLSGPSLVQNCRLMTVTSQCAVTMDCDLTKQVAGCTRLSASTYDLKPLHGYHVVSA